jgi:hypothetical protein
MVTVFWDRERELIVIFMQQGTTIAGIYYRTLKKLHENKKRGMLTSV